MEEEFSSDSLDSLESVSNANQDTGMDDVAIDDMSSSDEVKGKSTVDESFYYSLETDEFFPEISKIVMDEPLLTPKTRKVSVLVSWPDEAVKHYDTCILTRLLAIRVSPLHSNNLPELVSLSNCLEAFLREEPLGPEDMWYVPVSC